MINFSKIRYKNFLSTGNNFTEVDFNATKTALVVGKNGAGKSTMLDALSFGLFGKPHRKISKGQLVNSINMKNCLVEVEFEIGSKKYKVVRGIKPNKFEIWEQDNMINQNSNAKEYQQVLERNILKLSHKSFHQIVVLGSSSFIPFMQLNSTSRREVIEDLLDINIFSKMNMLLKQKVNELKNNIKDNSHELDVIVSKISLQKKYIRDLTAINTATRKSKNDEIESLEKEIKELQRINIELSKSISENLPTYNDKLLSVKTSRQKLAEYKSSFNTKVTSVVKESKFFEANDNCPTCSQIITEELRTTKLDEAQAKAKELNKIITQANDKINEFDDDIKKLSEIVDKFNDDQNTVNNNNQTISRIQKSIKKINDDLNDMTNSTGDMSEANNELNSLLEQQNTIQGEKYKLAEQFSYYKVQGEMLKDSGIKTKIIKQYVPIINQQSNKYLQILDFFVHFELDENFNETIRSRHRDTFTYDSFSEGEKQRIDLSLLFTWRQIAKMKNSVSTNLLVLDETFDSSLDDEGVDNLMKIIESLGEDCNLFVISHKSELEDAHFDRKLEFYKDKNFSKMREY